MHHDVFLKTKSTSIITSCRVTSSRSFFSLPICHSFSIIQTPSIKHCKSNSYFRLSYIEWLGRTLTLA
ncbi:hypothetical protein HOLleu_28824 [Holothuria leucospilota]|uniref:Uncharacterized protein n=1 Tax=Holothuria leucospilota TaxID=206669 RepID=A0A9Q1BMU0_HOLLE|nr:hypothetical protein HOLleu_28824 [Holothuria leucospilota]